MEYLVIVLIGVVLAIGAYALRQFADPSRLERKRLDNLRALSEKDDEPRE